jgi:sialate O-acetylesterase
MKKAIIITAILFLVLSINSKLPGQVKLPSLIRDNMVIQRDSELKIWGWAGAGEQVKVQFKGKSYETQTGSDGKWFVWLPPMKAGGPYTMEITASNKIVINNILVGDVWICAGQSNMVHYMDLHKERYAEEITRADYPEIRQFLITTSTNLQGPVDDLAPGYWKYATPEDVKRFSVVAYFFALHIYDKYHIPIGLINASVGGTPIEAWTSKEGLKEFPGMLNTIQKNKDTAYVNSMNRAAMADQRERNRKKQEDKGLTGPVT